MTQGINLEQDVLNKIKGILVMKQNPFVNHRSEFMRIWKLPVIKFRRRRDQDFKDWLEFYENVRK